MLQGLVELYAQSLIELQRLSSSFPLWIGIAIVLAALLGWGVLIAGRLVYRGWRMPVGLAALVSVAVLVTGLLILLLFASSSLRPAVASLIAGWQRAFVADAAWNKQTFRMQYNTVSALRHSDGRPIEDVSNHPPPDAGGTTIPVTTAQAKATIADIDSRRVADHFQRAMPILTKLLSSEERPLPDVLRDDMERYFAQHPDSSYDHLRSIRLAGNEMLMLAESKIDGFIRISRIVWTLTLLAVWIPLYAFSLYDAWKWLEPSVGRL